MGGRITLLAKWWHLTPAPLILGWFDRYVTAVLTAESRGRKLMDAQAAQQQDNGSKVMDTIADLTTVADNIATRYGHPNVATAIQQSATLAPVFYSIFDTIINLIKHHKQAAK
jgi:hypothetical protein